MKAIVLQPELSKLLNISSHFVSQRAQLPVLANIMLKASGAKLTVNATNLEMSLSGNIGAKIEEEGDITIPSKTLTDLVATLPNTQITLESVNESLNINTESFNGSVMGMNSSDFPDIPVRLPDSLIKLSSEEVVKALTQVLFSTSMDDTRPALAGVLLIFGKNTLSFVSSDVFRLSKKDISYTHDFKVERLIIPKSVLIEITKIYKDEEFLGFSYDPEVNQVLFSLGTLLLSSRVIEGDYPNFEKIIPTHSKVNVSVDRGEFNSAIKRAAVFAREGANIVKLSTKDNLLVVSAESAKSGTQESTV